MCAVQASADLPRIRSLAEIMAASLERCFSIEDLRQRARYKLPRPIFDYMDGGAEDEWTMRRNTSGFDDVVLTPRVLTGRTTVEMNTNVLGATLDWPLICAPTGASRFYHPDGERAVARACARAGVGYTLSTMATTSLEDVARSSAAPKIFQLYAFKDQGLTRELIERARSSGYGALCVTVDAPTRGKREAELKSGMGVPLRLRLGGYLSFAMRPAWVLGQARKGRLSLVNIAGAAGSDDIAEQTKFIGRQLSADVTWRDIEVIAAMWNGPLAVKGIVAPQDARLAMSAGASAIIVSNHGGRQLDGGIASVDALPAIVDAIGGAAEIILDGGVRRGVHIVKALKLGANAVMVGRPYLYGVATGGEDGVMRALDILREECVASMKLVGSPS